MNNVNPILLGVFALGGALGGAIISAGALLINQYFSNKFQAKLEWQKRYESDLFKAYNSLYQFTTFAHGLLWPDNKPVEDYRHLMDGPYFQDVKNNMLFFNPKTREILRELESQYGGLGGDPDLQPAKPFEEFFKDDLPGLLSRLQEIVEKRFDSILHEND
jgi:hypothetical protein